MGRAKEKSSKREKRMCARKYTDSVTREKEIVQREKESYEEKRRTGKDSGGVREERKLM